jgi:hypothetical protein
VAGACVHRASTARDTCGPQSSPFGHSALAWQRTGIKAIVGTVTTAEALVPLQSALVSLVLATSTPSNPSIRYHALSDASGNFRIDSVQPARYVLQVRRIEYRQAVDTIQIVADSGILVRAFMVPGNFIVDCGFYSR